MKIINMEDAWVDDWHVLLINNKVVYEGHSIPLNVLVSCLGSVVHQYGIELNFKRTEIEDDPDGDKLFDYTRTLQWTEIQRNFENKMSVQMTDYLLRLYLHFPLPSPVSEGQLNTLKNIGFIQRNGENGWDITLAGLEFIEYKKEKYGEKVLNVTT